MNSIESIIIERVMPEIESRLDQRLDDIRRDLARKFLHTKVSGAELQNILGWSDSYVYAKRKKGDLPFTYVNGTYHYDVEEILRRIDQLNFRNSEKVRERIQDWIDAQINIKLRS